VPPAGGFEEDFVFSCCRVLVIWSMEDLEAGLGVTGRAGILANSLEIFGIRDDKKNCAYGSGREHR
jgi:hypothetical protein